MTRKKERVMRDKTMLDQERNANEKAKTAAAVAVVRRRQKERGTRARTVVRGRRESEPRQIRRIAMRGERIRRKVVAVAVVAAVVGRVRSRMWLILTTRKRKRGTSSRKRCVTLSAWHVMQFFLFSNSDTKPYLIHWLIAWTTDLLTHLLPTWLINNSSP